MCIYIYIYIYICICILCYIALYYLGPRRLHEVDRGGTNIKSVLLLLLSLVVVVVVVVVVVEVVVVVVVVVVVEVSDFRQLSSQDPP